MFEHAPRAIVVVLAAVVAAALGAVGANSQPDRRGWRSITPSPMHWMGLWLSAGLSGFMTYIYLFVGSTRPDAAHQMTVLFWLIVAFGLSAIVAAVCIRLVRSGAVRWRGTTIVSCGRNGEETRQLSDVVRLDGTLFGSVIVGFRDGATLRLDPYASGAAELIEKISGMQEHADGARTG
jgi:hypothetical protein